MAKKLLFICFVLFSIHCGVEEGGELDPDKPKETDPNQGDCKEGEVRSQEGFCQQTPNNEKCEIANGEGEKEFDYQNNTWKECKLTQCKEEFHSDPKSKNTCISNLKKCSLTDGSPGVSLWKDGKWQECKDLQCENGKYIDGGGCKDCPKGHECKQNIKKACKAGRYQSDEGKFVCYSCEVGTYQDKEGQAQCKTCPNGEEPTMKKTACQKAGTNVNPSACKTGHYFSGGTCLKCNSGHFCKNSLQTLCPEGQYQNSSGASSCKKCPSGKVSTVNRKSCQSSSGGGGGNCSPGYYQYGTGCKLCDKGYYCQNRIRYPCRAGTYQQLAGQSSCRICPFGQYQPYSGRTSCLRCPSGKTSNSQRTACTGSTTSCPSGKYKIGSSCYPCIPGYYCSSGTRTACKPGTYQNLSSQASCKTCPSNQYQSSSGRSSCYKCQSGYTHNSKHTACIKVNVGVCSQGTYKLGSSCRTCPSGAFCTNGVKTMCKPGTFQGLSGQISCYPCGFNYYQPSSGQTSCRRCPSSQTNNPKHTSCIKKSVSCNIGYYASGTTCLSCPAGYFCQNSKKTVCPQGKFQPTTGQPSCLLCYYGFYNNTTGRTFCTRCPTGTTSSADRTRCQ